ncbi:MAG: DUF5132 domain-containing protein [Chloroflexi bacterium]|nr:DUF5132 domain-containing protein [Chloroflexota bacterium]
MGGVGTFSLGVAAALVAQTLGPAIARRTRPLARRIIKQAIIVSDGARMRADSAREDLEDLIAEAREEARRPRSGAHDAAPTEASDERART